LFLLSMSMMIAMMDSSHWTSIPLTAFTMFGNGN
jgi:hypothetical protein